MQHPGSGKAAVDGALVALARDGSEAAVAALVAHTNATLFRVVRAVAGSDAEADRIVAQSYVSALARMQGFPGGGCFTSWITGISLNHVLQERGAKPTSESVAEVVDLASVRRGAVVSPQRAVLEAVLAELPEQWAMILLLADAEGLGLREAARRLDLPLWLAGWRLWRARRSMRESANRALNAALETVFVTDPLRDARIARRVWERWAG